MHRFRLCVSCLKRLYQGDTTGDCTLYRSSETFELCEECFLDEDGPLFEMAGTNNIPWLVDLYWNARARYDKGETGFRPSQLYAAYSRIHTSDEK